MRLKKISITGGKGGTGKSTFAVMEAVRLARKGKRVILCDCDVECPNDYLILGEKLKKVVAYTYIEFPFLIKSKCKRCGLCLKTCRQNAIFQPRDKNGKLDYPVFIKDLCSGCGACWAVCPYGAIETKKEKSGKIYFNEILIERKKEDKQEKEKNKKKKEGKLWLVTGLVKEGLEETGPVVREVKEFALELGEKNKIDYIIFDTAAGTHCPVVSALLGSDIAYCLTEPTPMGAYDLKLILELCQKLKIPAQIILNQSDLGDKKLIKKVAKSFKTKIKKEILYSKEIAEAYSKGQILKVI